MYSILKFTESVCTLYDTDVDQIYFRFFLQILVCFYHFEYVSSAIRRKLLVHLTISIQLPGTLFNKQCTAIQQNITSKPLTVLWRWQIDWGLSTWYCNEQFDTIKFNIKLLDKFEYFSSWDHKLDCTGLGLWCFNATFNNIAVISWWSVLLVEETGVPKENHWHATSHWQTL